ncbi:MAG: ABC transporter permease [Pontiellaceae bacterium]
MKIFSYQLKKELKSFFYSSYAFIIIFFFWILSGLNFYWLLIQISNGERIINVLQLLFCGPLIIFSLPVIVPLLTMKLFSEEQKLGTLELLYTIPLSKITLILSKYVSALIFYLILWIPYIFYIFILNSLYKSSGIILFNSGLVFSGLFGILLIGIFYIGIGLLMSSITSSQVIASVSSFGILFGILITFMFMGINNDNDVIKFFGRYFSTFHHLFDFSRGIVDSRVIVYYIGLSLWSILAILDVLNWKRC